MIPHIPANPSSTASSGDEFIPVPRVLLTFLLAHLRAEQARFPARSLYQPLGVLPGTMREQPAQWCDPESDS